MQNIVEDICQKHTNNKQKGPSQSQREGPFLCALIFQLSVYFLITLSLYHAPSYASSPPRGKLPSCGNTRSQSCLHVGFFKHLTEVLNLSSTGGGNDWDGSGLSVDMLNGNFSIQTQYCGK